MSDYLTCIKALKKFPRKNREKALRELNKTHWIQRDISRENDEGKMQYCLLGLLAPEDKRRIKDDEGKVQDVKGKVYNWVYNHISDSGDIWRFNDRSGRKKEEVREALEESLA